MASFDVPSLFRKIPLDETIERIANELFRCSEYFHVVFLRDGFIKL